MKTITLKDFEKLELKQASKELVKVTKIYDGNKKLKAQFSIYDVILKAINSDLEIYFKYIEHSDLEIYFKYIEHYESFELPYLEPHIDWDSPPRCNYLITALTWRDDYRKFEDAVEPTKDK